MTHNTDPEGRTVRIAVFAFGILLGLAAGLMLLLDVIEPGWAIVVLIVGVGLIATSRVTPRGGSNGN